MQIPEGAKFLFIVIPLFAVVGILYIFFLGKGGTTSSTKLDNQALDKISEGKSMNELNDFDKLEIETVREGEGPSAGVGDTVTVNYEGTFVDGTKFDSSYDRNKPFTFTLGQHSVIEGWEEGIKGMKVGEERILKIPSSMGYGDEDYGPIPGHSGLIFKVEMLEIQ